MCVCIPFCYHNYIIHCRQVCDKPVQGLVTLAEIYEDQNDITRGIYKTNDHRLSYRYSGHGNESAFDMLRQVSEDYSV